MAKTKTTKPAKDKNFESELGDIAKLVLGKLDQHGLTLEQAVSAMQAAGTETVKEPPPKKAPAKKTTAKKKEPKSTAVVNIVDGQQLSTAKLDWK